MHSMIEMQCRAGSARPQTRADPAGAGIGANPIRDEQERRSATTARRRLSDSSSRIGWKRSAQPRFASALTFLALLSSVQIVSRCWRAQSMPCVVRPPTGTAFSVRFPAGRERRHAVPDRQRPVRNCAAGRQSRALRLPVSTTIDVAMVQNGARNWWWQAR
jgi:hypothetical protein